MSEITRLETLVQAESGRSKRLQTYIFTTIRRRITGVFHRPPSKVMTSPMPLTTPTPSFLPPTPISQRVLTLLTNPDMRYAFKVAAALSCLLAMLWSPATRSFFLNFAVRNSTVPLLLALMPTLGLSMLSWVGQLGGAILGVLYAGLIMLIWRGVGKSAYCVPGLFFFEWFLCLAVGHRMLYGPDFLAVTAMNGCAIVRSPLSHVDCALTPVHQCSMAIDGPWSRTIPGPASWVHAHHFRHSYSAGYSVPTSPVPDASTKRPPSVYCDYASATGEAGA